MALMFQRVARNFAKSGYFPTDEATLKRALAGLAPSRGLMSILDVCAGKGVAIADAARALGRNRVRIYAIEYDAERARAARARVDRCLHADFTEADVSQRSFGLLWLNPPYGVISKGYDREIGYEGQGRARLEKLFYLLSRPLLQVDGIMVLIIPWHVLDEELVGWLISDFTDLRAFQAADNLYGQIVVFGRRVQKRGFASDATQSTRDLLLNIGLGEVKADKLPAEWPFAPYVVPTALAAPKAFSVKAVDPEKFAAEIAHLQGLWPEFEASFGRSQQVLRPPVRALSQWHLALALAAGAISGVVHSHNRTLIVRGDTHKEKTERIERTERDDGSFAEKLILTDKFVPVIRAWDVTPGLPTLGQLLLIR